VGQIGRFTGVKIESDGLIQPLAEMFAKSSLIHWPSLILGFGMFALLWILRFFPFKIPGPILVVVISVFLSAIFDFRGQGIAVVGDIPRGLPSFSLPPLHEMPLDKVVTGSVAIFLVSFGSGIVAARSFASRTGDEVDANQELVGLGAANIAPGLFGSFPVSVSDSRTAINLSTGGVSQVAGLVSAAALVAVLVFLHAALRILPIPALAAILAMAAISLIDIPELRKIWRISRMEFVFALIAMWGAISFGVLNGVIVAIVATFVYLLRQTMFPRDGLLGRIEGRHGFFDLKRYPEARPVPGAAVFAVQGSILFYNADYVRIRLTSVAKELPADTKCLVLDASAITQIDSTGATALEAVAEILVKRNIIFAFADLSDESRVILERAGVIKMIGAENIFNGREEALRTLIGDIDQISSATPASNAP